MAETIEIRKFSTFLHGVWLAGGADAMAEHLRGFTFIDDDTISLTYTEYYDVFGFALDTDVWPEGTIIDMMSTMPLTQVVDGSAPIKIDSLMHTFPLYDDKVSPRIQALIKRIKELLPNGYKWNFTLEFETEGEYTTCSLTGTLSSEYTASTQVAGGTVLVPEKTSKTISGMAMSFNVETSIATITMMLPSLITR